MGTSLDSALAASAVRVDGTDITILNLSENERAILLIALAALDAANGRCLTAGREVGFRVGHATGVANCVVKLGDA